MGDAFELTDQWTSNEPSDLALMTLIETMATSLAQTATALREALPGAEPDAATAKRRKRQNGGRAKKKPKSSRPASGYNLFASTQFEEFKATSSFKGTGMAEVGRRWKLATQAEKDEWNEKAKDEWNEKVKDKRNEKADPAAGALSTAAHRHAAPALARLHALTRPRSC